MKPIFKVIALLWIGVSAAQAQQWDIEQCIRYAVENNIQVKQGQKAVEISRVDNLQTKLNYLPSLSASGNYNISFGRSLDPTTYNYISGEAVHNFSTSASLNTQLFGGMQKLHNLRRSEFSLLASIQDVERIKNEIIIAVTAAYLQVLYNKEQISVSENQLELLQSQLERTTKLVDAGSVPLGNRLELEAQMASEQYNLITYQNQRLTALLTLTQLLELRNVPEFDVVVPDTATYVKLIREDGANIARVDDVFEAALGLPQIELEKLRTKIAERDVSIARARYYPTLNFGASYGSSWSDARKKPQLNPDGSTYYSGYPFFDQLSDNASSALQFNMSIPIFNGLQTRNNVRKAKLSLQNADLSLRLAEDRLYKEIQQAWTDATGSLERFRSAQISVRSNEESFRYAETKFNAGATTVVEYNLAKNNLITAQSMMIQSRYDYIFKMKILDFYRGIEITL